MLDWIANEAAELSIYSDFHGLRNRNFDFVFVPIMTNAPATIHNGTFPHEMVIPPSIGNVPPVTQSASSEAKYRTILATSSGFPALRIG